MVGAQNRSNSWMICLLAALPLTRALAAESISGRVTEPDGKAIAEAVVFVQSAVVPSGAPASGHAAAIMDQLDKTFVPGLLPVVVGTHVHFPNHDQIQHHVYSFSPVKTFELPLYRGEEAPPVVFDKVGVVKIGCNIHDWMSGIILVLPTAQFAVTDQNGRFVLPDLIEGTYTLLVWHALSKSKPEETARPVQTGLTPTDVIFTLNLEAARHRPAVHGARGEP
jgi:plastocyanin